MLRQKILELRTTGRGSYDVTARLQAMVSDAGLVTGVCQIFCQHTSASLMLSENADPDVRRDLEAFMQRLVPDGDELFRHRAEGPDDMAAHVRTLLTASSLSLPIRAGRCALGTWQGVYLWEHRFQGHERRLVVTLMGEGDA